MSSTRKTHQSLFSLQVFGNIAAGSKPDAYWVEDPYSLVNPRYQSQPYCIDRSINPESLLRKNQKFIKEFVKLTTVNAD